MAHISVKFVNDSPDTPSSAHASPLWSKYLHTTVKLMNTHNNNYLYKT